MRDGIVVMKKKATGSRLWEALAPNFEDLRGTVMHVSVKSDSPSVLEMNGDGMAQFSQEAGKLSFSLFSSSVHCVIF